MIAQAPFIWNSTDKTTGAHYEPRWHRLDRIAGGVDLHVWFVVEISAELLPLRQGWGVIRRHDTRCSMSVVPTTCCNRKSHNTNGLNQSKQYICVCVLSCSDNRIPTARDLSYAMSLQPKPTMPTVHAPHRRLDIVLRAANATHVSAPNRNLWDMLMPELQDQNMSQSMYETVIFDQSLVIQPPVDVPTEHHPSPHTTTKLSSFRLRSKVYDTLKRWQSSPVVKTAVAFQVTKDNVVICKRIRTRPVKLPTIPAHIPSHVYISTVEDAPTLFVMPPRKGLPYEANNRIFEYNLYSDTIENDANDIFFEQLLDENAIDLRKLRQKRVNGTLFVRCISHNTNGLNYYGCAVYFQYNDTY
jgi:hypothetical protein